MYLGLIIVGVVLAVIVIELLKTKAAKSAATTAASVAAHVKAAVARHPQTHVVDADVAKAVEEAPPQPTEKAAPAAPVDPFAAAHAKLDEQIAALQAKKADLNAAKAALDKLTEGA